MLEYYKIKKKYQYDKTVIKKKRKRKKKQKEGGIFRHSRIKFTRKSEQDGSASAGMTAAVWRRVSTSHDFAASGDSEVRIRYIYIYIHIYK